MEERREWVLLCFPRLRFSVQSYLEFDHPNTDLADGDQPLMSSLMV